METAAETASDAAGGARAIGNTTALWLSSAGGAVHFVNKGA